MRPVTARFLNTVRESHTPCFRATAVTGFPTGVSPAGADLPILGGDVKLDATADVRGSLELATEGRFWPDLPTDALAPYGNEIHISRGIEFGAGEKEWVSQGYFRIEAVEQDDAPKGGQVRVTGRDRMAGIIEAALVAPIQFLPAASVQSVFNTLVGEVYPTAVIEFDFDAANTLLPGSHIVEEDRYAFLNDVVRAFGKIMFWDYEGKLRVESAPSPTVSAVAFDVNYGRSGVLVSMGRTRSRDGVFNAVVATGESPGDQAAVRAVARDLNTNSPTYWYGSFGKVPKPYNSPLISTVEQAATAAQAILAHNLGLPYSVDFSMVPNPALEPLDVVSVSYRPSARVELHVLEQIVIPLTVEGAMTAGTRERSGEDIGLEEL